MTNHERLEWAAAPMRLACDTTKQLDWLEKKLEWARLMTDTGMLSIDEACEALKRAGSNG